MSEATETSVKSFYTQILRNNGITDELIDVKIKAPELQGENFQSTCDNVTVHRKNGEPIELFVKKLVNNPEYSQTMKELKVFEKEAGFFNELLPELERIVRSRTRSGREYDLDFGPKCYFADGETTVMENLVNRGYILLDKVEQQDLKQARMVMKYLAKFHAPSYILLTEESNTKDVLSKFSCLEDNFLMEGSEEWLNEWLLPAFDIATHALENHSLDSSGKCLSSLKELSKDVVLKLQDYHRLTEKDLVHVVNHGDFWNNNMMFLQDPNTKKLLRLIFIDFQQTRVGSPNLDISFYFFTSVKHEVRRKEWKNLLQQYYDSFVENVESLKGKVRFSFEEFVSDYIQKFVSGFILGICMGGPMLEAMKDLGNLNDVEGNVMEHVYSVFKKSLENNPKLAKQNAQLMTDLFLEYREVLGLVE